MGVDEAGRGPLAGPVAVAAVAAPREIYKRRMTVFKGVKDSKKLTPASRQKWFGKIKEMAERGKIIYAVSFCGNKTIDEKGINEAVSISVGRVLKKIAIKPSLALILLDGGMKASGKWLNQKTIIGGDDKESIIAAASVAAKVKRDKKMKGMAKKYPHYNFAVNKGYGTKEHILLIKKHGLSKVHRKSFYKALDNSNR